MDHSADNSVMAEKTLMVADIFKFKSKIINGCLFGNFTDWEAIKNLKNLPIREDDIVISSYQRSGTHWAVELIDLVRKEGNTELVKQSHITDRFHWFEMAKQYTDGKVDDIFTYEGDGKCLDDITMAPSPRILVTHLGYDFMPEGVKTGKCKTIVVLRNPKSVLVSQVHLYNVFGNNYTTRPTLDILLNSHLRDDNDKVLYGTWLSHVTSWWKQREATKDHIFFLRYEDMKKDMKGVIHKLASFLNKDLDEETISKIVHHLTFEQMKANPSTGDAFTRVKKSSKIDDTTPAAHMRKGVISNWKQQMTVAQSERIDAFYSPRLNAIGLTFHYE
ncbi:unnamed protein product [Owenia fusiformis]|uniref:Uncharacterized protein n=1 Tax=Owenia fusiformis TaxID=6347 RepID=A0A8J1U493_OWEFU|nr:unnamed protein product [Owenia fusiformis]